MKLSLNNDVIETYGKRVHISYKNAYTFNVVEEDEVQEVVYSGSFEACVTHIATVMALKDISPWGSSIEHFNILVKDHTKNILHSTPF